MQKFQIRWEEWQKQHQDMNRKKLETKLRQELGDTTYELMRDEGRLPGVPGAPVDHKQTSQNWG